MVDQVLTMQGVRVDRGKRRNVLKVDELSLKSGELLAVVGPNGAGKSTLLQTMHLLLPFRGEISLFGENVRQSDQILLRRRLAMVFQSTSLLDNTVFNNIALGLQFRNLSGREIEKRVHKAAKDFQCEHLLSRMVRTLSGGELQRVGIARAMVICPQFLLLDEPFAALDLATRREIINQVVKLARLQGMTVVLVSHDFAEALYFADRAIALWDGCLIQDDTPEKILRCPVNESLARLVGMNNLIPCTLEQSGGEDVVKLVNGVRFLSKRPVSTAAVSLCCIPGDSLFIYSEELEQGTGSWVILTGLLQEIRPNINCYQISVCCAGQIFRASIPRHMAGVLEKQSEIKLAFQPEEVHFI